MNRLKKYILILITCISFIIFSGCEEEKIGKVRLTVSKDFFNEIIFDEDVDLKNDYSIMDILKEHTEVETSYGGSFVESINSYKSNFKDENKDKKRDWFYYVNGYMADVSCEDYLPKENDHIVFDYHAWSDKSYNNALISSFEKSFKNGYMDEKIQNEIVYQKEFEEENSEIKKYFNNLDIKSIELNDEEINILDETKNTILISTFDEALKDQKIKDLLKNHAKKGLYFSYENKKINLFDVDYNITNSYDDGVIIAFCDKLYPFKSGIFMILGTDENNIKENIKLLLEGEFNLNSQVFIGDKNYNLPIFK
ncbi:MAG: DUF4430 domain-containing protein [Peptostreptococcaceae bacterium]|nr:DUF4430 domain-containing protein [Peptostreptococcaceae bacterium]